MTRMLGLRPGWPVAIEAAGAACWANAGEASVAAATNVDVPSNIFRRLRASASLKGVSNGSLLLLIVLSVFRMKDESHWPLTTFAAALLTFRHPPEHQKAP